jgi:hypothetical protein
MRRYVLTIMAGLVLAVGACNTDPVSNLNQVSPRTSPSGFEQRFMGVLWTQRFDFGSRVTALDAFARDAGNFTTTDNRFITEWLGNGQEIENSTFFGTANWTNQFTGIRQSQGILSDLPNAVPAFSPGDIAKWKGIIYTTEALSYMYALATKDTLGLPVQAPLTPDPQAPQPILCARNSWRFIVDLLDSGLTQLDVDQTPGLPVTLPPGFSRVSAQASPSTSRGSFAALNRALAARANLELAYAIARSPGGVPPTPSSPGSPDATALARADSALHASALYDPASLAPPAAGGFNDALAVFHDFSGASGDLPNPVQAQLPTYYILKEAIADIDPADNRLAKTQPNLGPAGTSFGPLAASDFTYSFYPSPGSAMPIIRNEELNLFAAQIRLGLNDIPGAVAAINAVRTQVGGLPPVSAAGQTYVSVRNQILKELRASTMGEPNGDHVAAIRDYGLPAVADTTWNNQPTGDTHATVQPFPIPDVTARNGNTAYTCPTT